MVRIGRPDHRPRCVLGVSLFEELFNDREVGIIIAVEVPVAFRDHPRGERICLPNKEPFFLLFFADVEKYLDNNRPVIREIALEPVDGTNGPVHACLQPGAIGILGKRPAVPAGAKIAILPTAGMRFQNRHMSGCFCSSSVGEPMEERRIPGVRKPDDLLDSHRDPGCVPAFNENDDGDPLVPQLPLEFTESLLQRRNFVGKRFVIGFFGEIAFFEHGISFSGGRGGVDPS